jgi:hypothetical protein
VPKHILRHWQAWVAPRRKKKDKTFRSHLGICCFENLSGFGHSSLPLADLFAPRGDGCPSLLMQTARCICTAAGRLVLQHGGSIFSYLVEMFKSS